MSEAGVRTYASDKHFSPGVVERWLGYRAEDRDAVLAVAERLRLGENQVRDLLEQLEDIAGRQGSPLAAVLQSAPVRGVLERGLGRNETIHHLRQTLARLRYPQLSQTEEQLRRLIHDLQLPAAVTVEFPKGLEGEHVSVTVKAASACELRACVAALGRALEGKEVERVYALLEGKW
jgi:hypothetical protein